MQRYRTLLQTRAQFRRLWIAQVISLTGDWFNTIAIIILVNRYTDESALAISALFLARTLPVFFLSPLAGVIADRFDRKSILVISNGLRILVVLGFLFVDNANEVWLIYALAITQFALSAFFEPAYAAILPSLVKQDELLTANTLASITWSVMLTVGAVIGGLVTSLVGVQVALIVDAITFAVAALLLLGLRREFSPDPEDEFVATNRLQELIDGFRYVRRDPNIGILTLIKSLTQVGSIDVMIGVYATQIFVAGEEGATTLGILFAAHGLGAILGPLLGDWISDGSEDALLDWVTYAFGMVTIGWLIFGIGPALWMVTVGMVIRGMGGSINWTYSSVILQMRVPDKLLGRVFGLDFALFQLSFAVATLVAGVALETLDIAPRTLVMIVSAGSLLIWGVWVWMLRSLRASPRRQTVGAD